MENLTPALCALAGSLIGMAGGVITTLIIQHNENKRKTTDALIRAGMEQWIKYVDYAMATKQPTQLRSPEAYILHLLQFSSLLDGLHDLSDETVKDRIAKTSAKIKLITDSTKVAYSFTVDGDAGCSSDTIRNTGDK